VNFPSCACSWAIVLSIVLRSGSVESVGMLAELEATLDMLPIRVLINLLRRVACEVRSHRFGCVKIRSNKSEQTNKEDCQRKQMHIDYGANLDGSWHLWKDIRLSLGSTGVIKSDPDHMVLYVPEKFSSHEL
jgi:hypothetical protein